jgi:hypothetical protein
MPVQVTPDGVTDLPVIAAMFGTRISPDTSAIAPIIQPAVPQRFEIGAWISASSWVTIARSITSRRTSRAIRPGNSSASRARRSTLAWAAMIRTRRGSVRSARDGEHAPGLRPGVHEVGRVRRSRYRPRSPRSASCARRTS